MGEAEQAEVLRQDPHIPANTHNFLTDTTEVQKETGPLAAEFPVLANKTHLDPGTACHQCSMTKVKDNSRTSVILVDVFLFGTVGKFLASQRQRRMREKHGGWGERGERDRGRRPAGS